MAWAVTGRDLLLEMAEKAGHRPLDLSLGIPVGPTRLPAAPDEGRGETRYPPSKGTVEFRRAAAAYLERAFGCVLSVDDIAACAGSKEFIASVAVHLAIAGRDILLIPKLSYPTYRVGAALAGCSVFEVPTDRRGAMDLDSVPGSVRERARLLWVNSPGNPTGVVEDLSAVAAWGRENEIPVFSDEAYVEMSWSGRPASILEGGSEGVIAVHSLSKRSDAPELRMGFFAGDAGLVGRLSRSRRAAGVMAASASQVAGSVLLADDGRARRHREILRRRVLGLADVLREAGLPCSPPGGGLFVWCPAPEGDGDELARELAVRWGVITMPGSVYGVAGAGHVRVAASHDPSEVSLRLLGSSDAWRKSHRPEGAER